MEKRGWIWNDIVNRVRIVYRWEIPNLIFSHKRTMICNLLQWSLNVCADQCQVLNFLEAFSFSLFWAINTPDKGQQQSHLHLPLANGMEKDCRENATIFTGLMFSNKLGWLISLVLIVDTAQARSSWFSNHLNRFQAYSGYPTTPLNEIRSYISLHYRFTQTSAWYGHRWLPW